MIIEDVELRDIFKIASEEHLQNLEDGLLHLEKYSQDQARLEDVLREAHTLKGDSRMLGVDTVESLIHQLEESLGAVKQGEIIFSQICDHLYQTVDAIRKLVNQAVTGEPANVNVLDVLAQLVASQDSKIQQPDLPFFPDISTEDEFNVDALFPEITEANAVNVNAILLNTTAQANQQVKLPVVPFVLEIPTQEQPPSIEVRAASKYQIDTIRVEPQKLDILMTQAGELTVTKIRIARRLAEIEEMVTLWEDWSRDAFINRSALDSLQGLQNGAKQVQNFHHRAEQRLERLGFLVNRLSNKADEDTARLDIVVNELESGIRTLRLLPLATIFNLFP